MFILKRGTTIKHSEKRKRPTTYWKRKEYKIPKFKLNGGPALHLATGGGGSQAFPRQLRRWRPCVWPLILCVICVNLRYKLTVGKFASAPSVIPCTQAQCLVTRDCDFWWIQTCYEGCFGLDRHCVQRRSWWLVQMLAALVMSRQVR